MKKQLKYEIPSAEMIRMLTRDVITLYAVQSGNGAWVDYDDLFSE